jgi:hypothetical protein
VISEVAEMIHLATGDKTFRHLFEFLPARANLPGFNLGVLAVEDGSAKNRVIIVANHASSIGKRYRPAVSLAV